ncbi:hypothetical protein FRC04_010203 [Tulasnella sp. 424]|nr:hypothetical protein FRC04_010203 [Tulasnella sp. 424]KAG8966425.1 hypothetical protein FRC05_002671 [Tulasnella sp. 425]
MPAKPASKSHQTVNVDTTATRTRSKTTDHDATQDADAMPINPTVETGSKRKQDEIEDEENDKSTVDEEPATKKVKVGDEGHADLKKSDSDEAEEEPEVKPKFGATRGRRASKPSGTRAKASAAGKKKADAKTKKEESPDDAELLDESKAGEEEEDLMHEVNGVLERGRIYFFYRPKIDVGPEDEVHDLDDISKFHILLLPRESETRADKQRFRLFFIGKKRLPDRAKGGRDVFWASLHKFGNDFSEFKTAEAMGPRDYETKTKGKRHNEAARIAGRGQYALFSPKPNTPSQRATHLLYYLTHPAPDKIGEIQEELSIYVSGSFIIQIKNPKASNPPRAGLRPDKKAQYGEEVIAEKFGGDAETGTGRRFIAPNPASMLDFEGTEMLMIPEKRAVNEIMTDEKTEQEIEKEATDEADNMSPKDVLNELGLNEKTFPVTALEGDWL